MIPPLSFVILVEGQYAVRYVRRMLEADRRVCVIADCGDPQQAYKLVLRRRPAAVVLTLPEEPEAAWNVCRQISATCPSTAIICASHNHSPDLIIESMRAGAHDFLRLPIDEIELKAVLDHTEKHWLEKGAALSRRGRVIAVFPSRGGSGASFIAANLAVGLNTATVLVDLNVQAGALDLFLGVKPKFSIVDLAVNRERWDDSLIDRFLLSYSDKVSLLAAPREVEQADELTVDGVADVLSALQDRYDYTVLDLPHRFDALTVAGLDQADEILLVLTLDIVSARAAQRTLAVFNRLNYGSKRLRLILNRCNRQSDLEVQYIESFLHTRISHYISDDYRTVVNSINIGQPLVKSVQSGRSASLSLVTAELKSLAASIRTEAIA